MHARRLCDLGETSKLLLQLDQRGSGVQMGQAASGRRVIPTKPLEAQWLADSTLGQLLVVSESDKFTAGLRVEPFAPEIAATKPTESRFHVLGVPRA
jgi:hypothetical protein